MHSLGGLHEANAPFFFLPQDVAPSITFSSNWTHGEQITTMHV